MTYFTVAEEASILAHSAIKVIKDAYACFKILLSLIDARDFISERIRRVTHYVKAT